MSAITTFIPSRTKASVMGSPMPLAAPVTTALLPPHCSRRRSFPRRELIEDYKYSEYSSAHDNVKEEAGSDDRASQYDHPPTPRAAAPHKPPRNCRHGRGSGPRSRLGERADGRRSGTP